MSEFWCVNFPDPGRSEAIARSAEEAGWDGLYFPDTQCLSGDIYSAMCLAAKATSRLKVGTAVTNPITRHPSVTASAIATVQVESGGRAHLGIGRGDSALAYIGRKPASVATLERYMEMVQQYLRGDAVDIDGYASDNKWLRDIGHAKVPLELAATGPRVIAVGARRAEMVILALGASTERLRAAMDAAREERVNADPALGALRFGAYVNVACDDDVAKACSIIRGSTGTFAHFTGMSSSNSEGMSDAAIFNHIGANYDMANHARGASGHMRTVPDEFISRFGITGSVAHCVDRLSELIELGLDKLVFLTGSRDSEPADTTRSVERLTQEVFAQLRAC